MVEKIEGIKMERTHVTVVKWDMHAVTVLVVAEFGYGHATFELLQAEGRREARACEVKHPGAS